MTTKESELLTAMRRVAACADEALSNVARKALDAYEHLAQAEAHSDTGVSPEALSDWVTELDSHKAENADIVVLARRIRELDERLESLSRTVQRYSDMDDNLFALNTDAHKALKHLTNETMESHELMYHQQGAPLPPGWGLTQPEGNPYPDDTDLTNEQFDRLLATAEPVELVVEGPWHFEVGDEFEYKMLFSGWEHCTVTKIDEQGSVWTKPDDDDHEAHAPSDFWNRFGRNFKRADSVTVEAPETPPSDSEGIRDKAAEHVKKTQKALQASEGSWLYGGGTSFVKTDVLAVLLDIAAYTLDDLECSETELAERLVKAYETQS